MVAVAVGVAVVVKELLMIEIKMEEI